MYLNAIEIKRSILDEGNAKIAISLSNLGCLYVKWQKKLKEGELLLMKSSKICKFLNVELNHEFY